MMGDEKMVELLLQSKPYKADCVWDGVGTVLFVATMVQDKTFIGLLKGKGLQAHADWCHLPHSTVVLTASSSNSKLTGAVYLLVQQEADSGHLPPCPTGGQPVVSASLSNRSLRLTSGISPSSNSWEPIGAVCPLVQQLHCLPPRSTGDSKHRASIPVLETDQMMSASASKSRLTGAVCLLINRELVPLHLSPMLNADQCNLSTHPTVGGEVPCIDVPCSKLTGTVCHLHNRGLTNAVCLLIQQGLADQHHLPPHLTDMVLAASLPNSLMQVLLHFSPMLKADQWYLPPGPTVATDWCWLPPCATGSLSSSLSNRLLAVCLLVPQLSDQKYLPPHPTVMLRYWFPMLKADQCCLPPHLTVVVSATLSNRWLTSAICLLIQQNRYCPPPHPTGVLSWCSSNSLMLTSAVCLRVQLVLLYWYPKVKADQSHLPLHPTVVPSASSSNRMLIGAFCPLVQQSMVSASASILHAENLLVLSASLSNRGLTGAVCLLVQQSSVSATTLIPHAEGLLVLSASLSNRRLTRATHLVVQQFAYQCHLPPGQTDVLSASLSNRVLTGAVCILVQQELTGAFCLLFQQEVNQGRLAPHPTGGLTSAIYLLTQQERLWVAQHRLRKLVQRDSS
ncbi:hypothetical protein B0H14DRAFT_2605752 [Mycena olivaceomarginata]|nr:hypothetical protein B0H14DRAFT_2605752 [Mycena olivaceomarginata]